MTTPHEDDYPVSVAGRMSFTAPSVELAKALETIAPIPDAKSVAGFDAVRIEATDGGAVVVSAANPLMMAMAVVPDTDVVGAGCVEVSVKTVREFAAVCRQKVAVDNDVEALLQQSGEAVELELLYGLPICQHRTRRPAFSPTTRTAGIFPRVSKEIAKADEERTVDPERRKDPEGKDLPFTPPSMTPAQASALTKAASVIGEPICLRHTEKDGAFLATIGEAFGSIYVCTNDPKPDEDDEDGADEAPAGPVVDGAAGDVGAGESGAGSLRIVGAKPIGGVS